MLVHIFITWRSYVVLPRHRAGRTSALNPIDIELVKATRVIMTTQLEPRVLVHKAYKKDNG